MTTTYVSNGTALSTAINAASDGDTIICNDGSYGSLTLASKSFSTSSRLTIQAANEKQAVFSGTVTLNGVVGINWIGIHFDSGIEHAYGTNTHMLFQYCKIDGIFRYTASHDLTIQYCELDNCGFWPSGATTYNILFDENYHHSRSGDNIRLDGTNNITIQNSVFYDVSGTAPTPHWDLCCQGLSYSGVTPSDITIRGNIAIDNAATLIIDSNTGQVIGGGGGPQAYFFGGPSGGYQNILVEQNMAITNNSNGVRLTNPSTNCIVRNNSLISCSVVYNTSSSGYVSPTLQDNLALDVTEEAGSSGPAPTLSGNVTYSGGAATDIYDDPNATNGILDYQRFISSAYPTKGAATRIAEIQAGTNVYALTLAGMPAVGGATPAAPSIPGLPTISGTEAVNQILTATPSTPVTGYPTPTRTWQWYNSVSGAIAGATSQTYQLQASDEGDTVYVIQTETNSEDVDTAQSTSTGTIAAAPTAPSVSSFSPADNATGVALDALLTITFDTSMALGTGTINLWRPDDGIVDTWDVVANAGTGDHTVHADGNDIILQGWAAWPMHSGVTYSILIDNGALESAGGVAFPGISNTATWNFTTVGATPPDLGYFALGSGATIHLGGALLLI